MATDPKTPNETPRSEEPGRDEIAPVPDEAGPHDIPDEEVIEHTLPARSSTGDSSRPR